jgi:AtzE family amidohydrolase
MMVDLAILAGHELAAGVRARKFTATAVTQAALARIDALNPKLNAYTLITADRALAEAARVDTAVAAGTDPGPLAGVPYSVKNLFDLQGEVTLAGSRINADDPPAVRDSTAVARLTAAGAICLGATNMGEYAYDFVTINSHYGATRNPWDPIRSAGGSSGGAGASVAAGLCAFALGSDTNGSVRVPASFCGVWGLKPTYGRLSRAGMFPFAASLDTLGVLGRTVLDLATTYDSIAGGDARDPVCWQQGATSSLAPQLSVTTEGVRIARLGGYFREGWSEQNRMAVESVAEALRAHQEVELPGPELARAAAYIITATEGGELHRERLAARAAHFDPSARDRFIAGALMPGAWYVHAQRYRAWLRAEVAKIFNEVDVLIAPATPMVAPTLEQQMFSFRGSEIPVRANVGIYTQPITLVGLPVIAAPIHSSGSLPIAVQLIGKPRSEATLLRVARQLEAAGVCSAPVAN